MKKVPMYSPAACTAREQRLRRRFEFVNGEHRRRSGKRGRSGKRRGRGSGGNAPPVVGIAAGDNHTCALTAKQSGSPEPAHRHTATGPATERPTLSRRPLSLKAPGASTKPAFAAAVGEFPSQASCLDAFGSSLNSMFANDPACGGPGTLADGKSCFGDDQCSSGRCETPTGALCGQCKVQEGIGGKCSSDNDCASGLVCGQACSPIKKLGEPCTSRECESGTTCGSSKTCVVPAGEGGACKSVDDCTAPLSCKSGKCAKPSLGKPGDPCVPFETGTCDHVSGCDATTKKCVKWVFGPGEPCSHLCSGGATCIKPLGSTTGTCVKVASEGQSCDPDKGPDCEFALSCVNGKCLRPSGQTCPAN